MAYHFDAAQCGEKKIPHRHRYPKGSFANASERYLLDVCNGVALARQWSI